jgi:hypothetical protein
MMKELEDYDWFPQLLRKQQVGFIGSVVKWFKIYQPLVPILQQAAQQHTLLCITDCCSGSGDPAIWMHQQLTGPVQTTLTDKFPQSAAMNHSGIEYKKASSDVLQLQPLPGELYTMYNAFHHFTDEEQKKILQQFADNRSQFLIAELLQPDFLTLLNVIFTSTVGQLLLTPFIRPFSLLRLLFTYLLPINIVTVTYDGIVSVFKSKTVKQYQWLKAQVSTRTYSITVSQIKSKKANIVYIKGTTLLP